ncbi:MAG: DinB family protein [Bacteroidota bacterium]
MKQLLTSFAQYEHWANERLFQVISPLTEEQQQQEIVSSFSSVHKTCLHIWDATAIWWQRVHKVKEIVVPSLSFHPTMQEIEDGLLQQNKQWIDWVRSATDADISYVLPYKNMKGEAFEQEVKEILLHVNNHGSYHRGQLVTMLRQLEVEKIPQTDYILYARS